MVKLRLIDLKRIIELIEKWNNIFIIGAYKMPYDFLMSNKAQIIDYLNYDFLKKLQFTDTLYNYISALISREHLNIEKQKLKVKAELITYNCVDDTYYDIKVRISIDDGHTYFYIKPCTGEQLINILKEEIDNVKMYNISQESLSVLSYMQTIVQKPISSLVDTFYKVGNIYNAAIVKIIAEFIEEPYEVLEQLISCEVVFNSFNDDFKIKIRDRYGSQFYNSPRSVFIQLSSCVPMRPLTKEFESYFLYLKLLSRMFVKERLKGEIDLNIVNFFKKGLKLLLIGNETTLHMYYDFVYNLKDYGHSSLLEAIAQFLIRRIKNTFEVSEPLTFELKDYGVFIRYRDSSFTLTNDLNETSVACFLTKFSYKKEMIFITNKDDNVFLFKTLSCYDYNNKIFIIEPCTSDSTKVKVKQFNKITNEFEKEFQVDAI